MSANTGCEYYILLRIILFQNLISHQPDCLEQEGDSGLASCVIIIIIICF